MFGGLELKEPVKKKLYELVVSGKCDEFWEEVKRIADMYTMIDGYFKTPGLDEYIKTYRVQPDVLHRIARCIDDTVAEINITIDAVIGRGLDENAMYRDLEEMRMFEGEMAEDEMGMVYETNSTEEVVRVLDALKQAEKIYWVPEEYSTRLDTDKMLRALRGEKITKTGYMVRLENMCAFMDITFTATAKTGRFSLKIYGSLPAPSNLMSIDELIQNIKELEKTLHGIKKKYFVKIEPDL